MGEDQIQVLLHKVADGEIRCEAGLEQGPEHQAVVAGKEA